ncbi:bifunctional adenosylcobinamide kinase/adenosylcobinamide-phosphate guanylyltransferase [Mycolicibacterium sp.]|uniref:bifunctional adenosylcobinamide kinase/adenosylcobinamide-phosphate guanylyltransferase n=1 Tax=Mycolicibacterium sp. TaxID=2320850 RepID=UPI001A33A9C9|nr:bifunctional adenosylcobinamide kinase/adenosylcobinamide-phosphate guanylyltransferase [Mycolicibacterium sp.]MBJ7341304.1 bifunctional adenosylcobinamide kinase/adenosylcobinamide-phosphate guanylyltransferase [Mycolicibacterium sp.]
MRALALGGIRSGKSQWAETAIVVAAGATGPVRYVATGATSADPEWTARIDVHRLRRDARWSTVESADVATQLRTDDTTATLVDDMGGWLVAAMDRRGAWNGGAAASEVDTDVDDLVTAVASFRGPLALVSPEVGLTVVPATESGRRFADRLGMLNQRLASVCDHVVLVIAGQPLTVKETS